MLLELTVKSMVIEINLRYPQGYFLHNGDCQLKLLVDGLRDFKGCRQIVYSVLGNSLLLLRLVIRVLLIML